VYFERITEDHDMTKKDVPNLKVCKGKKRDKRWHSFRRKVQTLFETPLDYWLYCHFNQ